jgi:hypothetical protein
MSCLLWERMTCFVFLEGLMAWLEWWSSCGIFEEVLLLQSQRVLLYTPILYLSKHRDVYIISIMPTNQNFRWLNVSVTSEDPILIVGIVIGAGLIIETMIDVPHQLLVHPHVLPWAPLRYSQIIDHTVARQHLIERLPDDVLHDNALSDWYSVWWRITIS